MIIHPRSSWTTEAWGGTMYRVPASVRTVFMVHYEGGTPTKDTGAAAMRSIDAGHRARGWNGIGYNFVIFPDGSVWEGRGWTLVGAHCTDYNRIGIGVQIHIGGAQAPTPAALASARELYLQASAQSGHALRRMGHQDGYATLCPGTILERWVRAGMPDAAGVPLGSPITVTTIKGGVAAPVYPLPAGYYFGPRDPLSNIHSVSGFFAHREDLRRWQRRMVERGWDLQADGLYGPVTANVARHFQREKHLAIDGLIGPQTWAAAWTEPITL
jgi:peptidoglycan hydrolase-like protein with peptidoglycan-binding domain